MSGVVCQVIDRKENTNTGVAELTLLDTDFVGATLVIGDDPNYPQNKLIEDLDYIETGTILSEQLLDNTRAVQVELYENDTDLNIKNAIELTNVEVARFGTRVTETPFSFISDINASWYSALNPDSHNVNASADYDVLKEYAENVKKLYGFYVEHSAYCERLRTQLAEWSKNEDYTSSIDKYNFNWTSAPNWTGVSIITNEYSYDIQFSGNENFTIGNLVNTPADQVGTVLIEFIYTSGGSGGGSVFVTVDITNTGIENDGITTTVTDVVSNIGAVSHNNFITYNANTAVHFDAPVGIITLSYLQTRVLI